MTNNNFKKKMLSAFLSILLCTSALAGCTSEKEPDETDSGTQTQTQGTENTTPVNVDSLTLVENGVSEYVIVRGENASASEVTASTELQSYLKQISGAELPIVTDSTEATAKEIVVGKTNRETDGMFDREELGNDGFVIKTAGEKLYLVGGEQRGTLYSVYSFLEEYLGCRYYTNTVEKVPEIATISIASIEENKQIPVFDARLSDWLPKDATWSVKQKINDNTHLNLTEEVGGGITYPGTNHSGEFVHSMQYFVNYYTYIDEHPEYFAVDEYGKIAVDDNPNWTQCCLTNPDVLQITIEGVRKMLEEHPDVNYISVSENDTRDTCKCANCLAIDEEEGSHAGTMLRFVNAIADNIKDDYPDVTIDALAYLCTIDAPTITKPRDNVVVRLAPYEQCIIHSTETCDWFVSQYTGKTIYQTLQEWAAISNRLFIWDYSNNFAESVLPWPSLYSMRDDIKMYADNHVSGIFFQGNSHSSSGEFGELRCYLLAKLFWNPQMSDEEFEYHINDFLEGYYGAGWQNIRAYLDDLLEIVQDQHCNTNPEVDHLFDVSDVSLVEDTSKSYPAELTVESFINYETVDWTPYYEYYVTIASELKAFIERAYQNFEAAEALAKDEAELARIQKSKIQVEDLEISYIAKTERSIRTNLVQLMQECFAGKEGYEGNLELQKKFISYIDDLYNEVITEKNSALFDEMLRFWVGATPSNPNLSRSKEEADLTKIPEDWYD